ncbi:bifunctional riboflavin kinase/FAD synthetase [Sphingomonas oligophenolica]|uniref:Riboflavin biosynthesis protein n=1 Tax=Sphingomonas oligophenolica TaxID=301154 RepID=A0A502CJR7_9SPHN|nr:bifunctional riboflavin kinase/FAD synthetase [Sphingomonas oligophenolica]TPG12016.1 bifunctional riboflavin kinase/FAD synthetase [Sphingomonas oligophenolica]
MQRLDGGSPIPPEFARGIVALGNFDGFHLGHQAVVGRAVARARAEGRPALVATFDPHPVRLFRPKTPPFRLTTLDQREALFGAAGVDAMIVFHFDRALAALTAEEFVVQRLVDALRVGGVVTGEDFTFGKGKSGDVATLARAGAAHGFSAETVGPVTLDGETVSSTSIRAALRTGDTATATRLLTRPFAIHGVVQHGDKVGRTIGYPTANIDLGNYLRPAYGIYAVSGRLADGRMLKGAANLGVRPTFDPPKELLEPHFFDFDGDLYGQEIEVALVAYLRPEAKFNSLEALTAQMDADCTRARVILG